jgi:chemotaxis protein MotB
MSGGGGRLFEEEEEEHENHERYLITYADMITLLLALFIILFAIGQTDMAKYDRLRAGINKEFGGLALEGGTGILEGGTVPVDEKSPDLAGWKEARPTGDIGSHLDGNEKYLFGAKLEELATRLGWTEEELHVRLDSRGVVVVLDTDGVTFSSGSWVLEDPGKHVIAALFEPLRSIDNDILLEGHTNDRPMTGGLTNWELSANRAGAVARYLIDEIHFPARRLAVAGYSDTRPIQTNATDAGRRANRRVEIVVLIDEVEAEAEVP